MLLNIPEYTGHSHDKVIHPQRSTVQKVRNPDKEDIEEPGRQNESNYPTLEDVVTNREAESV